MELHRPGRRRASTLAFNSFGWFLTPPNAAEREDVREERDVARVHHRSTLLSVPRRAMHLRGRDKGAPSPPKLRRPSEERRTDPPYPGWGSGGGRFARQPGQGVERVELDWNQFESSCELSCTIRLYILAETLHYI